MRRSVIGWLAAVSVLALAPAAWSQTVQYRDRAGKDGKPRTVVGAIKSDTPAGLTIKPTTGPEVQIPAADVIDVTFDLGGKNLPFEQAKAAERKSPAEGIAAYTAVIAQLDPKSPESRQLQYHVAVLRALLAEE